MQLQQQQLQLPEEATAAKHKTKTSKWYGSTSCWLRNSYLRYRWWYRCCCCCSAAIGATSEDPKVFGKALIFVALGEGIALYGLLISILILNKVA
ncbi:MAG: ATP synthase subunit C [Acutalibacteraceae bacterium]